MAKSKILQLDGKYICTHIMTFIDKSIIATAESIIILSCYQFSLGPLVGKVKDYQVEVIVDTLCNNMVGDKEQLRDISSIGLKTVINELPLTTQTLAATGNYIR